MKAMRGSALAGLALCLAMAGTVQGRDRLPAPPQPFGFVLGNTTEAEARVLCRKDKAEATARGFVDTRPAPDAAPEPVANPRTVLLDIAGLPMAGLESTRLAFLDDRLYAIAYRFTAAHDTRQLLLQLEAKYGKPEEQPGLARRLEWRFEGATLAVVDEVRGPDSMVFLHTALHAAQVEASQQAWKDYLSRKLEGQRAF